MNPRPTKRARRRSSPSPQIGADIVPIGSQVQQRAEFKQLVHRVRTHHLAAIKAVYKANGRDYSRTHERTELALLHGLSRDLALIAGNLVFEGRSAADISSRIQVEVADALHALMDEHLHDEHRDQCQARARCGHVRELRQLIYNLC